MTRVGRCSLLLVVATTLVACPAGPECMDHLDDYPPETVTMLGARETEIRWASWNCPGYDADIFQDEIPDLALGPTRVVRIDVPIRDGAEYGIGAIHPNGSQSLAEGQRDESVSVVVPEGSTGIAVRLCTDDDRCATYQANLTNRPDGR